MEIYLCGVFSALFFIKAMCKKKKKVYSRVVNNLEFFSFLESEVVLSAGVIVVQRYKESYSTTCTCVQTRKRMIGRYRRGLLNMSVQT